jgi:hypothetical protein
MSARNRLALLLAALGVALVFLVSTRSVFSRVSNTSSAAAQKPCLTAEPQLSKVGIDQLVQLRARLLPVVAPLGGRYAWGTVAPEDAWSDESPQRPADSRLADRLYPASYEMRVWAYNPQLQLKDTDIVADVFLFPDAAQARRFFTQATSTRCHRNAGALPARWPAGARDLRWLNPDDAMQSDVFLLRSRRVYRVSEALPPPPKPTPAQPTDFATVNTLACVLREARCPTREKAFASSPLQRT